MCNRQVVSHVNFKLYSQKAFFTNFVGLKAVSIRAILPHSQIVTKNCFALHVPKMLRTFRRICSILETKIRYEEFEFVLRRNSFVIQKKSSGTNGRIGLYYVRSKYYVIQSTFFVAIYQCLCVRFLNNVDEHQQLRYVDL